ncbi:hypothetical protein [Achromobacter anxifer]|uniref:hypothetical protein n=1 Tax=Achromobacter anxifer TaxID=1287737 RepID=UPI00158431D8|nr:hypothetical protein [Achromobacter anxifer]
MKASCIWLPEAIAIAGVALGTAIAIRGWPSWPWPDAAGQTWAAWAAAIATFLAAVIALWVAGRESRRSKRDKIAMAALYAAYLTPKLERYCEELRGICAAAFFAKEESSGILAMREKLEAIEIDLTLEQLMHLVPLEQHAAHRIAHGLAEADIACRAIRRIVDPSAAPRGYTQKLGNELSDAVDHIFVATETCKKLAAKYARPPSGQELYGNP